jgi:tetratricopeptide (TPR) repeat protein
MSAALNGYQNALRLNPENAGYHDNYGLALVKSGLFVRAQAELARAVQLDSPNAGRYYYNIAAMLFNIGRLQDAMDAANKALAADSTSLTTRELVRRLEELKNQPGGLAPGVNSTQVEGVCFVDDTVGVNVSKSTLIRSEIDAIAQSGRYAALPAAAQERAAGLGLGVVRVIENRTPFSLRVVFSGPTDQEIALAAGATQSLTLPAGTYRVLGRVGAPNVLPFYGEQIYESGTRYTSQFFISTSVGR